MQNRLIKALSEGLPLEKEPFSRLASGFGIEEAELIAAIRDMKEQKVLRQISPIYDTRMLGYKSSLAAFRVASDSLEKVAELVNSHPGVSHNYQRNHDFNLWFTLAVPPDSGLGLERTVALLAEKGGVKAYVLLGTTRVFKIGVRLNVDGGAEDKEEVGTTRQVYRPLTSEEKGIISVTQDHLPLVSRPFEGYAKTLGMDEAYLISKLLEFRERGIMRRFAAVFHHRKVGFSANGMAVWKVPLERVEEVGNKLAAYKAVSHCYERTINEVWQYNLFSMIHGKSLEEVEGLVETMSRETQLKDFRILYSSREFKKVRPRYFTGDYYLWEKDFCEKSF